MTTVDLMAAPLLEELEPGAPGPKVVALGGGHGLAQALTAIRGYAAAITAVVSVADDGGSSGRLTPALGVPPPGDCRRALLALSADPSPWRGMVCHRFEAGDVAGHSLGNLLLAALAVSEGGLEAALAKLGRLLGVRGRVVPAAPVPLHLQAVIDGIGVRGQTAIALSRGRIESLAVEPPDAAASASALAALAEADQVVVGPGSLFTSLAATLVVPGMTAGLNASPGRLVYICNLTTQDGETLGLDGAAHVRALCTVTGMRAPDVVVANDAPFRVPAALEAVWADRGEIESLGAKVEAAGLADAAAPRPQHDAARLGAVLRRLA
ncbi:MAG: uridine diphosphate-N-acetylglucosamine-binding protein YvcK [Actinomycetota bacterium]